MSNIAQKSINSELKFVYSDNDTLSIIFQNNEILLGVVGEFNNNIKELEKITKTNIYSRGNSILVKSSAKNNEIVKNAIKFLSEQFIINGTIEKKDIISSVNKFMIEEKINSDKNFIAFLTNSFFFTLLLTNIEFPLVYIFVFVISSNCLILLLNSPTTPKRISLF